MLEEQKLLQNLMILNTLRIHKEYWKIDPRIKHLEDELISALGTKVKLTYQKGSGKIIVNYFSDDDFDRIFSILTGNK